jgi:hypothetical protein
VSSRGEVGRIEVARIQPNSIEAMRILLQHARTGLYLRGLGDWAANPYEAFDFQHSQKAIDYACKHGIVGVQIAVRFIDSDCDEVVPLPVAADSAGARRLTVNS